MQAILLFVAGALLLSAFSGCARAIHKTKKRELPASCTLAAMSKDERETHYARLQQMAKAAVLQEQTTQGFAFEVNLKLMPESELRGWAQNEQRCCGFIKIHLRRASADRLKVTVDCPEEMQADMIQVFGLQTDQR